MQKPVASEPTARAARKRERSGRSDPESIDSQPGPDDQSSQVPKAKVLVVVLGLSGPRYLEECAASLKAQTHKNLQVVHIAEKDSLRTKAAEAFGNARVGADSFSRPGAVANVLLPRVSGFDVVVFIRDDTILEPHAIAAAVGAIDSGAAGIIGGKIISADNPDVLVEVGLSADRFGVPYSRLEGIEIDQQQYDQARQTLFVSFAFMAVRRDLLEALEGFDEGIEGPGVEIDFCWRARLVGEDVLYLPDAKAHQGTTAVLHAEHAALVRRNQLRLITKVYGPIRLLLVGLQAFTLTLAQSFAALLGGDSSVGRAALEPWSWNIRNARSVLRERRTTQHQRKVRDREVTRFLVRGAAVRLRRMGDDGSVGERMRAGATSFVGRAGGGRYLLLALLLIAFTLAAGRSLIGGITPVLGGLALPGDSAVEMLGTYLAPFRAVDVGTSAAASSGLAATGLAGIIFGNSAALIQKLFLLFGLPLAAFACARSLRPTIQSPGVRAFAAAVYAFGPLWWNALATGDLNALALAVMLPMIVRRLAHLAGLGAYATDEPQSRIKLSLALILALSTAIAPATIIAVLIVMAGWLVAALLVGNARPVLSACWGLFQAAVGAFVLLLPWSLTFLTPSGASSVVSAVVIDRTFLDVVRFDTAHFGGTPLAYGLIIGAILPLFVVRGPRFGWATRWWTVLVISFFVAWLVGIGVLPPLADVEILLAPAALGIAMLIGWGIEAIRLDLPEHKLGWRQPLTIVLIVFSGVGMLSPFTALPGGRFGQPEVDWRASLSWQGDEAAEAGEFRNLFLGRNIPGGSRHVESGVRFGVAPPGGPQVDGLWLPPASAGVSALDEVARAIAAGEAPSAGALLAPFGVRYVVVPAGSGGVADSVRAALDLSEVQEDANGIVFENDSWRPVVATLDAEVAKKQLDLADAASEPLPGVSAVWDQDGRAEWNGQAGGNVYGALPDDTRFKLETSDADREPTTAYGWAIQYPDTAEGKATLVFKAGPRRPLEVAFQVVLWVLALIGMARFGGGRNADESRANRASVDAASEPEVYTNG